MHNDELRYEYSEDGVLITGYNGYPEVLIIPDEIDGKKVTGISEKAFSRCLTLKSVTIREGIISVGVKAFYDCPSLREISLPSSLRKIGGKAFEKTAYFEKEKRVNGKLYIGAHLIKCVGAVGRVAVNGCIGVADEAFENNEKITALTFFDGLKYVGDRAFSASSVTEVSLPEGVESIGDHAFADSPYLSFADLKKGLKRIGEGIFEDTPLASSASTLYVGEYLLRSCEIKVKLRRGTSLIADCAFAEGPTETVNAGDITSIPSGCFFACKKLKKVTAPFAVKVGDSAFAECSALQTLVLDGGALCGEDCFYNSGVAPFDAALSDKSKVTYLAKRLCATQATLYGEYAVKEGTVKVYPKAFAGNSKLVKITIPDSVREVGAAAFKDCKNLTFLRLPAKMKKIPRALCKECNKLKELISPVSPKKVECNAFENTALTTFSFDGVEEVEREAFLGCSNMDATISDVRIIGERAFERSGLTKIVSRAEKIGKAAFAFSRSLRYAEFETLYDYPEECFYACSSLKEFLAPNATIKIGKKAFALCGLICSIDLSHAVLAESSFEKCAKLAKAELSYSVPKKCFSHCVSLRSVHLNEGVKSVDVEGFSNCSALEILELPSTLTLIGEKGFCESAVVSLTLPEGVKIKKNAFYACKRLEAVNEKEGKGKGEIGDSAFEKCARLKTVTFSKILSVGKRAFAGCAELGEARFSEGLESVGEYAFEGAASLEKLFLPTSVKKAGKGFLTGATIEKDNFPELLKAQRGILLNFSGNTIKYKGDNLLVLPVFSESCFTDENWMLKDLSSYDAFFGEYLEDKELKEPYVKSRLIYPYGLLDKNKNLFLKEYFPRLAEIAVRDRNIKEISVYAANGCFTAENIPPVLELASSIQAVEITALLLATLKKIK